ncbi:hypothetical protein KR038_004956 [Drosophila bunnanda]|nr:hypothetical protein KR038_004956 [Drosophila bunnanda]
MELARKILKPVWRPVVCGESKLSCSKGSTQYYMWHSLGTVVRPYCERPRNLVLFPVAKIVSGKSKYMMAKVYIHGEMGKAKEVVRSNSSAKYHLDIYDALKEEAEDKGLCTQGQGGGFLIHDEQKKYIKLYGKSQSLGKANHEAAKEVLLTVYEGYKIDAEPGDIEP